MIFINFYLVHYDDDFTGVETRSIFARYCITTPNIGYGP